MTTARPTITLQSNTGYLHIDGRPLSIQHKAVQVLKRIALAAPDVVGRDELIDEVWDGNYLTGTKGLRMEVDVRDDKGNAVARVSREFGADGYTGEINMAGGGEKPLQGHLTAAMYQGATLGLPLATLDFSGGNYEFDVSMVNFNAKYRVIATYGGMGQIEHDGKSYAAHLVDVEWFHENGDVYPPGPDASGGRYWLRASDDVTLPYVLRYKTDTYAVEYFPDACSG